MFWLILTTWIACVIYCVRHHPTMGEIADVWASARWWERCALLLFIIPMPGPVDEIVAGTVMVRVLNRMKAKGVQ